MAPDILYPEILLSGYSLKDFVDSVFCFRDREKRVNMVHLVPDKQFVGRITVEHPEELRNVGEKDLAGSHKNRDVADALHIPVDWADMPVVRVEAVHPFLCTDGKRLY